MKLTINIDKKLMDKVKECIAPREISVEKFVIDVIEAMVEDEVEDLVDPS